MAIRALGNCVACHAVSRMSDVPFQGEVGPSLDGAADRWDEAQLRGIVANAKMIFDGHDHAVLLQDRPALSARATGSPARRAEGGCRRC